MIALPPLIDAKATRVHLIDLALQDGQAAADAPLFATMRHSGAVFPGDRLVHAGLPMPVMNAESVALFALETA